MNRYGTPMPKQEFFRNLRTARNLFFHRVQSDHTGVNAKEIEQTLSHADFWLTPAAVAGFDDGDFPELSEASRAELGRNVSEFRAVAELVPIDAPASAKQSAGALKNFMKILQITEPYLPTPDEVGRLREAMKRVPFPAGVLTWEFEFGQDSSGDPAVWIWVVVEDAAADDPHFAAVSTRLQRTIHEELQRAALDRWPYLRFRTESEQRALQAVAQ
jgi:hypothetical protein